MTFIRGAGRIDSLYRAVPPVSHFTEPTYDNTLHPLLSELFFPLGLNYPEDWLIQLTHLRVTHA